ncbi:MAG: hypothetical protein LUG55_10940 [Clostridiales bacterium]|nr:hypothetical protein [Clostridiales bacterium]
MSKLDWKDTAALIAEDALAIQKGEKVVIVSGEGIEKVDGLNDLYLAVKDDLYQRGIAPVCLSYLAEPGKKVPELVETVCCDADVIITIYTRGLLHSDAWPRIREGRKPSSRLLLLPNGNSDDFLNRMMPKTKERFYEIAGITDKIGGQFLGKHTVRLTAPNGTDLTFRVGQLAGWAHSGVGTEPGSFILLPAGTLNLGVDEGSAEGTLVIDCHTALKWELMEEAVTFQVKNGYAVSIQGGSYADEFAAAAAKFPNGPEETLCIAEFGLGFDKVADVRVNPSEGEHMYGAAHIGIGSNGSFGGSVMIDAWHIDCILEGVSVEPDGKLIEQDGQYLA